MVRQTSERAFLSTCIFAFVVVSSAYLLCGRPNQGPLTKTYHVAVILLGVGGLLLTNKSVRQILLRRLERKKLALRTDLYAEAPQFREVDASAFRGFDVAFYDASREHFASQGFRHLADVEYANLPETFSWARGIIRILVGDEETVMASIHQLRIHGWRRLLQYLGILGRSFKVIDLETELSDGSFVTTSSDLGLNRSGSIAGVNRLQVTPTTTPEQLLASHRAHLCEVLAERCGSRPSRVGTLSDVVASQSRLHVMKHPLSRGHPGAGSEQTPDLPRLTC